MKSLLSKHERKALRFAYDLMRGAYTTYLPYVYGLILRYEDGKMLVRPGYWIEPDRDPDRPYLNEIIFTHLMVRGYFECRQFLPGPLWLYRLSKTGCMVLGWDWPLSRVANSHYRITPRARRQQQETAGFYRQGRRSILLEQRQPRNFRSAPFRHPVYHRMYK